MTWNIESCHVLSRSFEAVANTITKPQCKDMILCIYIYMYILYYSEYYTHTQYFIYTCTYDCIDKKISLSHVPASMRGFRKGLGKRRSFTQPQSSPQLEKGASLTPHASTIQLSVHSRMVERILEKNVCSASKLVLTTCGWMRQNNGCCRSNSNTIKYPKVGWLVLKLCKHCLHVCVPQSVNFT